MFLIVCAVAGEAFARYPRNCTTCRACIERFPNKVELRKIKDHFICKSGAVCFQAMKNTCGLLPLCSPFSRPLFFAVSIESTGSVPAPRLFKVSLAFRANAGRRSLPPQTQLTGSMLAEIANNLFL